MLLRYVSFGFDFDLSLSTQYLPYVVSLKLHLFFIALKRLSLFQPLVWFLQAAKTKNPVV